MSKDKEEILFEGYFSQYERTREVKWGDRLINVTHNLPQLFKDPELQEVLVDYEELIKLFRDHHPAVMVTAKKEGTDFEPYKYAMKIKWTFDNYPGRFTPITSAFTYEREFGENIVEVELKYVENPYYIYRVKHFPDTPTHVWDLQDKAGTKVYESEIKKVFGFNEDGTLLFEDFSGFSQGTLESLLILKPHRIFIVTR